MPYSLRQRKVARVLFDESHGEAWSVRPDVAAAIQPEHPAGSSYALAAAALAERDFDVATLAAGPLSADALSGVDVLVIAHPSDARWERTVGGSPVLSVPEIEAVAAFVADGGGLVVLGETEEDKYGANLSELLERFGLALDSRTVEDYVRNNGAPTWVFGEPDENADETSLLHLVRTVCFYRAGALRAEREGAIVLRAGDDAYPPRAGLLAAVRYGEGRVVVTADSDLFGDDALGVLDHQRLWLNCLYWVALPAFRAEPEAIVSSAAGDPAWERLRDETDALRALQEPKGEIDLGRRDGAEAGARVAAMTAAIGELGHHFPHQRDYLAQVVLDLRRWADEGFGKPDFGPSLAVFRPELSRADGIEHLVVFPMYTPNGSPDTRFEALIVRTPWPEFIDRLERGGFDNAKFVPVQLVDHTAGYDGECAVLFPETVSVAERPTNNFGGIFCDRESARFQRSTQRAAEALRIDLPPDAAALVASGDLSRDVYILWDMIHDRWHSHGDLPFDPFMIRQRLPYWMYSLEELRVDLATYETVGELAREGFPFARYVRYGVLFDRILRFPITGNRVRNYDGLGGQLLFAYLHRGGIVRWTDNRLLIDWEHVDDAVAELKALLDELYRDGIDLSKVSYWIAAHDLVARFVRPNVGSQWQRETRVYSDEADTRPWIDRVLDDEFPLSMFYETLKKKLAELAEEPVAAQA